jgi:hypothetical protein
VSAPPTPRIVWNVRAGSTNTQICVSSGWAIGLNFGRARCEINGIRFGPLSYKL